MDPSPAQGVLSDVKGFMLSGLTLSRIKQINKKIKKKLRQAFFQIFRSPLLWKLFFYLFLLFLNHRWDVTREGKMISVVSLSCWLYFIQFSRYLGHFSPCLVRDGLSGPEDVINDVDERNETGNNKNPRKSTGHVSLLLKTGYCS
jgi:hypothetical protein